MARYTARYALLATGKMYMALNSKAVVLQRLKKHGWQGVFILIVGALSKYLELDGAFYFSIVALLYFFPKFILFQK